MIILALDSATTSGWASGAIGERPSWGTFTAKGDSLGEKAARFRFFLMSKVAEVKPDRIVFEAPYIPVARAPQFVRANAGIPRAAGPPPMNPATLRLLLLFVGLIEEIAFERGIECREVDGQTWAKFFLGQARFKGGSAQKKAASIAMCQRFGWDTSGSNDAADALGIWSYAEHCADQRISARRAASIGNQLALHGTMAQIHG